MRPRRPRRPTTSSQIASPTAVALSRRRLLQGGAAAVGAAALAGGLTPEWGRVLERATAAACSSAQLSDVGHIVMFMQENRSFDQYFGLFPGVRGFGDPTGRFVQPTTSPLVPGGQVLPMHTPMSAGGGCLTDVSHDWEPQHGSWNGGTMDGWVDAHALTEPDHPWSTMSYYDGADLPFYDALAEAFTLCDGYHCSVLGPTDPNHLYWLSAWLDPAGTDGGPLTKTTSRTCGPVGEPLHGAFTWRTMPEVLHDAGVTWKVYGMPDFGGYGFTQLFDRYVNPSDGTNVFFTQGVAPTYADFLADAAAGTLPQVSWVVTHFGDSEHADNPPQHGQSRVAEVLAALTTVPEAWAQTVLFLTYDENGGFFDHVAPPVPPPGTLGEFLTAPFHPVSSCTPTPTAWVDAPIGLGFRVPMTVVSPFSRGGFVCSDTFDHTSMLRFIETRFAAQGVEVPNLTAWRRSVTGDLTTALDLASPPRPDVPVLPLPGPAGCSSSVVFPLPDPQTMPVQPAGTPRRPSGCVAPTTTTTAAPTTATTTGASPATVVTPAFTG